MDERKEELHIVMDEPEEQRVPEAADEAAPEAPAEAEMQADQEETEATQEEPVIAEPSLQAPPAPADDITVPIRARKGKKRKIWLWILIPAILLLLGAGAYVGYYYFLRVPSAEQVVIKDNQIVAREGNWFYIPYDLYPSNAEKSVKWASSNPEVATVDDKGNVTAVSAGHTMISATAKSGAIGQCYVTVRPQITAEEKELLGVWTLFAVSDQGHIDYYYGSSYVLKFYSDMTGVLLENGEETSITWEFDEIIDGYNYYNVRIPTHRGATLSLNSNTGDGMSGSLTLGLSDTLLWVFLPKK